MILSEVTGLLRGEAGREQRSMQLQGPGPQYRVPFPDQRAPSPFSAQLGPGTRGPVPPTTWQSMLAHCKTKHTKPPTFSLEPTTCPMHTHKNPCLSAFELLGKAGEELASGLLSSRCVT